MEPTLTLRNSTRTEEGRAREREGGIYERTPFSFTFPLVKRRTGAREPRETRAPLEEIGANIAGGEGGGQGRKHEQSTTY